MKILFRPLFISISLFAGCLMFNSTTVFCNDFDSGSIEQEMLNCKYGQCQAIAKSTKKRCKKCVSNPKDKYCSVHD